MKRIVLFLIVTGMSACLGELGNYTKISTSVPITSLTAPDDIAAGSTAGVDITLEAENSCFGHMVATLVTVDAKHFRFEGTGIYESHGNDCSTNIVRKDTTITFKIQNPGKYYIQANLAPYIILKDSIMVH